MSDTAQPRKAPSMPADMKAFNAKLIEEFRANHGEFSGDMKGRSLLILTTTGTQSRKPRSVVLGYGRHGDQLLVLASDNGAPTAPSWYRNLLAHPTATVELGPDRFEVRATTAAPEEREELAKALPYLEQQQSLTTRRLPIVVFERV